MSEWPYSPEYIKDLCQKVTEARTREGEWESEEEGGEGDNGKHTSGTRPKTPEQKRRLFALMA